SGPAFTGRAPGGVAAYELSTGRSLWTRFDESSVMTSPVIRDSAILYVTAAGVLRRRELSTGKLVGELTLPGGASMAPPAARGETLVATLELNRVCALRISTLSVLWCRTDPRFLNVGHAAPTIVGDEVLVSGLVPLDRGWMRQLARIHPRLAARMVWSAVMSGFDVTAGQMFAALDLRDGHVRWASGT